jgi:hypothetical protein
LVGKYRDISTTNELHEGVNLSQPKKHGLTSIDKFYTDRNLIAASAIWKEIRCIEDTELSAAIAFVFTSLYKRITKLSEYRFWGGSGNTANFNVPYISNESNVFISFLRKAKSIADHISTTGTHYSGRAFVNTGTATNLAFLPDESVDFIFTDPPFGANINYSDMNVLWESWLGDFTNTEPEAIMNRIQGKGVDEYRLLMLDSLKESYRVLRKNHWMVLVFMNSSEVVWEALYSAILESGFEIEKVNIFDKRHGTFKQYVSDNTAGSDLIIHCRKLSLPKKKGTSPSKRVHESISTFIQSLDGNIPTTPFLHVKRNEEIDYRTLYSRYLSAALINGTRVYDFAKFRVETKKTLGKIT